MSGVAKSPRPRLDPKQPARCKKPREPEQPDSGVKNDEATVQAAQQECDETAAALLVQRTGGGDPDLFAAIGGLAAGAGAGVLLGSANQAPQLLLPAALVTQHDKPVTAGFVALDKDGDALTFAVTSGAFGKASISAGQITYTPNPGYVGPDSITVTVTDEHGGRTSRTLPIDVRDDTPPRFTSASRAEVSENSGAGQLVYRALVTDASPVSFSLKPANDAAAFSINGASGAVKLLGNPDFVAKSAYTFTVVAVDALGNSSEQTVTLQVKDATAPKFTSADTAGNIPENSGAGQVVYRTATTDASPVTYALEASRDRSAFSIDRASGAVTLLANPDFESKSTYTFTVIATDAAGNSAQKVVRLAITDVFEDIFSPVFTSSGRAPAVDEHTGAGQLVYQAAADDHSPISFSLKSVDDFSSFTINASSGAVTLLPNPDFETKSSYAFTILAVDRFGNRSEKSVSLAINDVTELSVFSTGSAFAVRLFQPGTISMSQSGVLADFAAGATTLTEQASLKQGFLNLVSGGQTIASTSQYVVLGTAGADTHDARGAGLQVDYIYGGAGNDTLRGGVGDDILYGAASDDDLYGDENVDLIYGGEGNDDIEAGEDDDTVYGGLGDDTIDGGSTGADTLYGEAGDDRFLYAQSADLFTDSLAVDRIDGGSGSNTIVIGELTQSHEYMFEITVEESFARIANVQRIEAASGTQDEFRLTLNDNAYEAGLRVIDLSPASHLAVISNVIDVSAESGVANGYTLTGHGGPDQITGGAGPDGISGGGGRDTIVGSLGGDTLLGGNGSDVFLYTAPGETLSGAFTDGGSTAGMDVIADAALGDVIDLWDVFSAAPTIVSTYLASAQANYVAVVRGSYVPAGQTFTSGSGVADNDYLLQWSDGTVIHGVILKDWGTSAPSLSVNPSGDQITFADVTAPTMVSASYSGTEVVITYSEPLSGTPEAYDYTLGGTMTYIRSASLGSGANSNKVFLTLYNSASSGSITSIAYNANSGTANSVQDVALNAAPTQTLASGAIAYGDFTAPSIVSAEYEGSTLTLYYSEDLAGSVEVGDFTVSLSNSTQATISSGSISGKTVVLSTSSPLAANSIASLSYSATSGAANSIKDAASPANSAPDQTLSTGIISLFSALNGRSVSGTPGSDKFVISVGDTGVSIGDFTSGTDKVNVDALETYNAGGFNFTFTGPGNSPSGIPEGTLTYASVGPSGAADTKAGAAAYLSTVAAWNSVNMPSGRSGYFVVVDDNSTGLFKFVSDGLNEVEVGELTLIATIGSQTVTSDYVFA